MTPALQCLLTQQRQAQKVFGVRMVDRGATGAEELRQPAPLRGVQSRSQLERRLARSSPTNVGSGTPASASGVTYR